MFEKIIITAELSNKRLDQIITELEIVNSRNKAISLIMSGKVFVNENAIRCPQGRGARLQRPGAPPGGCLMGSMGRCSPMILLSEFSCLKVKTFPAVVSRMSQTI